MAQWLAAQPPATVCAALAAAAALEYVFPPAPGDAIAIIGIFLASQAEHHPALVYGSLTAGSTLGSLATFQIGRWLRKPMEAPGFRVPFWLGGSTSRRLLQIALERFERHGAVYLTLNRFLPSLRAVFFLAAGLRDLPLWKVVLWGGISAAAWNGILLAVGMFLQAHWSTMVTGLSNYSLAVWILLALAIGIAVWRGRRSAS